MKTMNLKKMILAGVAAATLLTAALPAMAEASVKAPTMQQGQIARGGKGQQMLPNGQQPGGRQAPIGGIPSRGKNNPAPGTQQPSEGSETQPNADTNNDATPLPNRGPGKGGRGMNGKRGMRNDLDELLSEGIISQETYDAIKNSKQDKALNRYEKLLEDGKLTQEEYDAIKQYIESRNAPAADAAAPEQPENGELPPEKPEGDPALAALVEQGVITKEQADAIEAARNAAPEAPEAAPAELEADAEA